MTKKKETPAARGGGRGAQGKPTRWGGPYSDEARLRAVQEIVDRGATMASVSRALGVPVSTLQIWVRAYREQGEAGIRERVRKLGRPYSKERAAKREAVVEVREAHPEYGTRRIRDVLARFEALGVSESVVRRVLHEEGLLAERPPPTEAREHPERRFERASQGTEFPSRLALRLALLEALLVDPTLHDELLGQVCRNRFAESTAARVGVGQDGHGAGELRELPP